MRITEQMEEVCGKVARELSHAPKSQHISEIRDRTGVGLHEAADLQEKYELLQRVWSTPPGESDEDNLRVVLDGIIRLLG